MTAGRPIAIAVAVAAFFAASMLGVAVGAVVIAPGAILTALVHPAVTRGEVAPILWSLRIPRVLEAAVVGAALAVAGTLMQGMLRNPLVDPFLTGASAGSACAIALAIAAGVASPYLPLLAFAAALATVAFVATLARNGSGLSPERLILAGIAVSTLLASVVTLVILLDPNTSTTLGILAWIGGSLTGRGWPELRWATVYAVLGVGAALGLAPTLNAMRLGERRARALGVDVDRARWAILGAASLLTAAAVSLSGLVGFVGLIVPHVARRLVGSDARWLIPASALLGASGVILADALARSAAPPLELPLGVLLAILGVPAFVYLSFRRRPAAE